MFTKILPNLKTFGCSATGVVLFKLLQQRAEGYFKFKTATGIFIINLKNISLQLPMFFFLEFTFPI